MMRKVLTAAALVMVVFLAGCNQEKAKVTEYLQQVEASNQKMKALAKDMESQMSGLQKEIASGNFDAEAVKKQITDFSDKMKAEKQTIEGLEVPEKAQALHDATVKQYQLAVEVLAETLPMIDIAKKMTDAAAKVKADPKQAKAVMAELQAAQTEIMELQKKVEALTKEGKDYEKTARDEQKKLSEEFGIVLKTDDAGGEEASGEEASGEEAGGAESGEGEG